MFDSAAVLWIPGQLPGMNTIINAKLNVFGTPRYHGKKLLVDHLPNEWNQIKKRWHSIIDNLCNEQEFDCPPNGYFTFMCIEPNKRRNKDNVGSGATKVILDALVARGSLLNDGWKEVLGYRHYFDVHPEKNGVYVIVTENACLTDAEASRFFDSLRDQGSLPGMEYDDAETA